MTDQWLVSSNSVLTSLPLTMLLDIFNLAKVNFQLDKQIKDLKNQFLAKR